MVTKTLATCGTVGGGSVHKLTADWLRKNHKKTKKKNEHENQNQNENQNENEKNPSNTESFFRL